MAVGNWLATIKDNSTGEVRLVEKQVKPSMGGSTSGNTGSKPGAGGGRHWTGTVIGVQKSGK